MLYTLTTEIIIMYYKSYKKAKTETGTAPLRQSHAGRIHDRDMTEIVFFI